MGALFRMGAARVQADAVDAVVGVTVGQKNKITRRWAKRGTRPQPWIIMSIGLRQWAYRF